MASCTALVNPVSSITDGAFTLITIGRSCSSPALAAATSKLLGIALPLGLRIVGAEATEGAFVVLVVPLALALSVI
jgi:hypothetical protein